MRIRIKSSKRFLTKKQKAVIEHLCFQENWGEGGHGALELTYDIDYDERKMITEELDENKIKWVVIFKWSK